LFEKKKKDEKKKSYSVVMKIMSLPCLNSTFSLKKLKYDFLYMAELIITKILSDKYQIEKKIKIFLYQSMSPIDLKLKLHSPSKNQPHFFAHSEIFSQNQQGR
jgi:hypothetical protein